MSTRLGAASATTTHLSPDQLARLRTLLMEEQAIQESRADDLRDPADIEADLAKVLLERCQETLDEIDAALRLHDQGNYGACTACGSPIPYERLVALPAASRCVSCQSNQDRVLR